MQLRWLAVGGQVVTILFVDRLLGIALPLGEMMLVLLLLILLNLASLLRHRRVAADVRNGELFGALLFDLGALTTQLYLSGGASNPFISLYLLQIGLAAVLLERWSTWVLVGLASLGFVFLMGVHRPLALPVALDDGVPRLYLQGVFVCFLIAAGLLVLFLQRISRNLRIRDEKLADLRQRAVEEDHIVRMGLLASGAAHELGTPLSTLSVILNDWRRMPVFRAEPELIAEIGEMQAQLDRCKTIVSGILMSSGEARAENPGWTTVRGFVDELIEQWRSHRAPMRLDYENAFAPDAEIVSDPALRQVLGNLLDNAQEASPHVMAVRVERRGEDLVIIVADEGPGFPPDILAGIGKPYRSTKGRPGGGLGLFLVSNVMRKFGGTLNARNRDQGGACVTVTLPLAALSPVLMAGEDAG
ncbi:MAG: ATP-binding protein [Bosea sp. (in: a-proteobacteria)]|uniref:ATP-binding protein n=1 Tax=Bosea sp. (in: a-proteobacteria) TaxID=1871050 RepID=UPI0027332312|nr:ATP-binding protein [Bosea sp. (in: a-proteobacteria)]MDP3255480.1 ATP-binding protein [Bosea sp. (in: a-proteobacteria)]MDP3318510.1 ATP-binding protein [Bosea sp. (in: a-proteobacteria)]